MLNRTKLIRELQTISNDLFQDHSHEHQLAKKIWDLICADPTFANKIREIKTEYPLPGWQGKLGEAIPVEPITKNYCALSVDGSQIYPDKHQGTNCFLINTGSVLLSYGEKPQVHIDSEPYVFTPSSSEDNFSITTELVNCKRQELEFQAGIELYAQAKNEQAVLLFDGSLIFWHLDAKDQNLKDQFLNSYLTSLDELHQNNALVAGYISLPKSKDVVNLVRVVLENPNKFGCEISDQENINHMVDAAICSFFLPQFHRTIVFKSNASITKQYPEHLKPHFFYLHVGDEIGRVEVPAWIAKDETKVATIARVIIDQCQKGRGYPVVLAEAHEQAVVKGPDREFFYQLITKFGIERKRRINISQKSLKKRGIGI